LAIDKRRSGRGSLGELQGLNPIRGNKKEIVDLWNTVRRGLRGKQKLLCSTYNE